MRETETVIARQTDRDRQRDRDGETETDRPTERQTERDRKRERQRQREEFQQEQKETISLCMEIIFCECWPKGQRTGKAGGWITCPLAAVSRLNKRLSGNPL